MELKSRDLFAKLAGHSSKKACPKLHYIYKYGNSMSNSSSGDER